MKEIRNVTHAPLKVHLPGGKTLHLGPGHTGRIANEALEHQPVQELLGSGKIKLIGDGHPGGGPGGEGPGPHEETHGHHPPSVVRPKGDR